MSERPRDERGYPIPWDVPIVDGVPQFRETDPNRTLATIAGKLCGLCGVLMERIALIGGPIAVDLGLFTEPPMHPDCARYALKVCPFLVVKNARYSGAPFRPETELVEGIGEEHPEVFGLVVAEGFKLVMIPDKAEAAFQPEGVAMVFWYREGKPARRWGLLAAE